MTKPISDIAFTQSVKRIQEARGSRGGYAKMEQKGGWQNVISENLRDFITTRDSIYLGTATKDGQPYIQHRGGKPGFLKVMDNKTLAFADFKGNRQYISSGNLAENNKAFIFLMDYANRQRIKIWGTARIENDPQEMARLADADYAGVPEQAIFFEVSAWDVNCPQHITQRFSEQQVSDIIAPLNLRIAELEAQLEGVGVKT